MNLEVMSHFIHTEQPTMDLRDGLSGPYVRCWLSVAGHSLELDRPQVVADQVQAFLHG